MFDVNTFDSTISKYRFNIKVWTLPDYTFELEKIANAKYFLHIKNKETGVEEMNKNNVHFEIHYNEHSQLVALYFWNGVRGWYLNTTDVFDMNELHINVAACIGTKFEMMRSNFEKFENAEGTIANEVVDLECLPTKTKDFIYCVTSEKKIVFAVRADYEKTTSVNNFEFPKDIVERLNAAGIFHEKDTVWIEDGRYIFEGQLEKELDNMDFSPSTLLKENMI